MLLFAAAMPLMYGQGVASAGIYDDRDSRVVYAGSGWTVNNDPNRYQNTQSFSNHAGDSASFTFTGTQVSYVYARQGNLGNLTVTIDGTAQTVPSNLYAPSGIGEQVITYSGLSNATHTITVQALGTPVPNSADSYIVIDAFIVGTVGAFDGIYDNRDSRIVYAGSGWTVNNSSDRYQNTQSFSNHTGDTATFTFTGTQVNYIYAKQGNLGYVQISIDGTIMAWVDPYSPTWVGEQVLTYSGLANRTHTITVQVFGIANAQSSDTYVVVDAFIAGPAGPFDGVYDDRDSNITYAGSGWAQNLADGRYNGTQSFSNQGGNTASFTFTGTQIGYVYELQGNMGNAQISIDGAVVDQLDEYSSTQTGQTVATYSGLANRTHTIAVTALGTANAQSANSYVIVDAFTVGNSPLPSDLVTISGRVLAGGAGAAGVSVLLAGSQSASVTTDTSGNYSFAVPSGGNYTVTPSASGYAFNPSSAAFSYITASQFSVNFAETASATVVISGHISEAGTPASGVTLLLSGGSSGSTITDANGNYSFAVASGLSYVVTPSEANVSFSPASLSFSNVSGAQTADFTASPAILAVMPLTAPVNSTVTITGTHFGATQGSGTVTFNGTVATPMSWQSTEIVVPVPAGATSGPLVVTAGGVTSNGVQFGVIPNILGISLPAGPPQMGFVISGTSFGAAPGMASLNGAALTIIPGSWSDTSIKVQVPTGATTGNVVVTTSAGRSSNGVPFTVSAPFGCGN